MFTGCKFWAWMRVSTDKQDAESQELAIRRYCEAEGVSLQGWIKSESQASSKASDKDFERLLEMIPPNAKSVVITTELSRIGRSLTHVISLLHKDFIIAKRGLITIKDTPQIRILPNGEMDGTTEQQVALITLFASMERRIISQRTSYGMEMARAKGKQIGRRKGQKVRSKLDEHAPAIINELKLGVPFKTISERYGVAVSTVTRWAKRNEVYQPKQKRG